MLRASILASVALLALIAPASAFDLVVVNEASFSAIHKLYLAPAKSNAWGEEAAEADDCREWTVHGSRYSRGRYDVKIIDDDDDGSCVVAEITINKNEELRLTDEMMLQCAFKAKDRSGL